MSVITSEEAQGISFGKKNTSWLIDQHFYGFKVAGLGLLLPQDCPGEIVRDVRIFPLPYTRAWLKGVISLRGTLIPVFDLQQLLFGTSTNLNDASTLVLGKGRKTVAVVLAEMPRPLSKLEPISTPDVDVPEILAGQIIKSYRSIEGDAWLAFDVERFSSFLAENAKVC